MIDTPKKKQNVNADFVAKEALYLDKDGNVVGDKDPKKLSKLVSAGGSLPYDVAQKYGLTDAPVVVAEEKSAAKAVVDTPKTEAVKTTKKAADKSPDTEPKK